MPDEKTEGRSPLSIFLIFLRLGLTSFGGPFAHLGYFRNEFVTRRKWLSESSYADLVALCQFLPGPSSSQVGISIGMLRGGYSGAFSAWAGFTLPSAVLMFLFALGLSTYGEVVPDSVLHGLKIVAVAVVAQAVWGMARNLCADVPRATIMAVTAGSLLIFPFAFVQIVALLISALLGIILFKSKQEEFHDRLPMVISRRAGILFFVLFISLLLLLPIAAKLIPGQTIAMVDSFYRSGSLIFGGGHVVLPLLRAYVVPTGWVSEDEFLAGYGAAQAIPGPLVSFSAFLGASMSSPPFKVIGAIVCLFSIFAPSFLLIFATLPFWERLRRNVRIQSALGGINAAVVGLLLAALITPVWTSAIFSITDFVIALSAYLTLMFLRVPSWVVVIGTGFASWGLAQIL